MNRLVRTEKKYNGLVLENARLRAKNELLEKQVKYFQDIFAKNTNKSASSTYCDQIGDSTVYTGMNENTYNHQGYFT